MFLGKGFTRACLKVGGKDPSDNDMLTIMLMGLMSTSKQDLRRLVGIMWRSQEVSEEDMIILLTSSSVDGTKEESRGGGVIEDWSVGGIAGGASFEHTSDILSSKKFRKEAAKVDAHEKEGKHDIMYNVARKKGIQSRPELAWIVLACQNEWAVIRTSRVRY